MKNSFGNSVILTIFGESHGPEIGCVLSGLAPGIPVSEDRIRETLALRRPSGAISTARVEQDEFRIVSGVYQGKTTGTPLTILIPNTNTRSRDYAATRFLARPGHADYTAWCKYHGFEDPRGGGHQSGRLTAALVAAGGILLPALERKGIRIGSHILKLGGGREGEARFIEDSAFSEDPALLRREIESLRTKQFPVLDPSAGERMQERILQAKEAQDSVGGILETAVTGVPAGIGEPWFDTVESELSHVLFAIPAVKGVEFGDAFSMVGMRGSEYNDAFSAAEPDNANYAAFPASNPADGYFAEQAETPETGQISQSRAIRTETNHNGGVNGGITNGMPILFRTAVKPTPSIGKTQKTVNFETGEDTEISVSGRHDPAIIHRARIVLDCAAALVISDLLARRYGTDGIAE